MIQKKDRYYSYIFRSLEKMLLCYNRLLALSIKQREVLDAGGFDKVNNIMDKKDICIKEIGEADLCLKNIGNGLPYGEWIKDDSLKSLLALLEVKIKEVIDVEKECRTIMVKKRQKLLEKFHKLSDSKRVISRYYTGRKGMSLFVDYKE